METELFRVCTTITLGNGRSTKFWHDRWLQGKAPKEIAPPLLRFAWRKNSTVSQAMTAGRWMKGLQRISSTEEVQQFVMLWNLLRQVQLTEQPDNVIWRFTENGHYSSRSAYAVQFQGSFADNEWGAPWKAKTENKCKFFGWLILQNKLWTTDRITKNGG
jgi:hypothetical protein